MKRMRIFVSSTFLDLQDERDLLINSTFQKLRYEANKSGVALEVIDLRWGIPSNEESATINWCLELAEACRPYLLAIVGGRAGWVPSKPGNKTITELELERFIDRRDGGLNDARALALFKKVDDDSQVRGIRAMLRDAQLVDIYDYSQLSEIPAVVDAHFSKEIARLASSVAKHESLTVRSVVLPQSEYELFSHETTEACNALALGQVTVLESTDSFARILAIRDIAGRLQESGHELIYVDVAAEALATSGALVTRLESLGLISDEESQQSIEILGTKILAIEGLETLLDFEKSPQHADTLLLSGLLRRLGKSHEDGLGLLIASDFTSRPELMNIWNKQEVVQIRMHESPMRDLIISYFHTAGKQLTKSQIATMVEYATKGGLSALEVLLRCDQLRRSGALNTEQSVSQDEHVDALVSRHFTSDASTNLASDIINHFLEALPTNRRDPALSALAMLTGLNFGAGFADLETTGLTAFEWGILRATAGGALVGDLHRVRVSRPDIREQFKLVLGEQRVDRATGDILTKKLRGVREAETFDDWYDFSAAVPAELLFQAQWWNDPSTALPLFDARVWPALVCYDPGFFSQHILGTLLTDARLERFATVDSPILDPDQQILGLTSLAKETAMQGSAHVASIDKALDQAERSLNLIVPPAGSNLATQFILTGYAISRSRHALNQNVNVRSDTRLYLMYALSFYISAMNSAAFRNSPGSEYAIQLSLRDIISWFLRLVEEPTSFDFDGSLTHQMKRAARHFDTEIRTIIEGFCDQQQQSGVDFVQRVALEPEHISQLKSWLLAQRTDQ